MHYIDLGIIVGYLVVTLFVGLYQSRKIKSMKDYAIADRDYSTGILLSTITATFIGGGNTIGIAEKIFSEGLIYVFICLAFPINALIMSFTAARRIHYFQDCYSAGDIMEKNYGKAGKIITGLSGTFLSIGYVGAQVGSIGYLLSYFLPISYEWGVWMGTGLIVLYTTSGGIRSVTMTDVIQFSALIMMLPIICSFGLEHFGGYEGLFNHVPPEKIDLRPAVIDYPHYIALFLVFCIPFLDPAVVQRMLMAKDVAQIRNSLNLTALIEAPFYITIGLIAFIALAIAPDINPNNIFPYLMDHILPVGFKGLVVTGLLAVIMSTADSYLNVAGVTFVHDFIKPLVPSKIDRYELIMTKVTTFIIGISAIIAALKIQSIIELILGFLNVWGPVIVIPLFATLFGIKANIRIFITSICAGLLTFILWQYLDLEKEIGFGSLVPSMLANGLTFFTFLLYHERKRAHVSNQD
tara:strand:+ start:1968 stop:3365 length:1398 start_codon:yes stop_codon:yes gene_type:complete